MEHYFVDTDVIIDFLGNRKPFSKNASSLFLKAQNKEVKLYTSSNSITTAYYILCKSLEEAKVRSLIPLFLKYIQVIPVSEKNLVDASNNSDIKDFEDAVQHSCALNESKISCIITRNLKDYKKSKLKVRSSAEF